MTTLCRLETYLVPYILRVNGNVVYDGDLTGSLHSKSAWLYCIGDLGTWLTLETAEEGNTSVKSTDLLESWGLGRWAHYQRSCLPIPPSNQQPAFQYHTGENYPCVSLGMGCGRQLQRYLSSFLEWSGGLFRWPWKATSRTLNCSYCRKMNQANKLAASRTKCRGQHALRRPYPELGSTRAWVRVANPRDSSIFDLLLKLCSGRMLVYKQLDSSLKSKVLFSKLQMNKRK